MRTISLKVEQEPEIDKRMGECRFNKVCQNFP